MSRTLTPAAQAAAGRTTTRPLYLIEIGWGFVSRLSTAGPITWNGLTWSGDVACQVSGISATSNAAQQGRLSISNTDLLFGTLALSMAGDVPVRIWHAHADALADLDPALVFDGAIDAAEVSDSTVELTLGPSRSSAAFAPRLTVGPDAGFTVLLPAGTRVPVGNQVFVLER